jgi:hypothetical protein
MDNDRNADSAKDFVGKVEGAVGSMVGTQAAETLREGSQAVAKRVEDNPLSALLVAVGIGFALAMLMTRPLLRPPPRRWRDYER